MSISSLEESSFPTAQDDVRPEDSQQVVTALVQEGIKDVIQGGVNWVGMSRSIWILLSLATAVTKKRGD